MHVGIFCSGVIRVFTEKIGNYLTKYTFTLVAQICTL